MFNKPTVIVVGAGASAEFNLPTGAALKSKIGDGLRFRYELGSLASGDSNLLDAIRVHVNSEQKRVNEYTRAGRELAETINTFPSIDEALHWWRARSEIVELGKVAAAHYILESEAKSPLILNRQIGQVDVDAAGDCWLRTF